MFDGTTQGPGSKLTTVTKPVCFYLYGSGPATSQYAGSEHDPGDSMTSTIPLLSLIMMSSPSEYKFSSASVKTRTEPLLILIEALFPLIC